ncbi:hypothetical protein Ct61P_07121 [Colletotrichum tofieldiae]|nr:hypothetical protein Ct61P_07121 [Colletotrichum tofieldiae]
MDKGAEDRGAARVVRGVDELNRASHAPAPNRSFAFLPPSSFLGQRVSFALALPSWRREVPL